MSAALQIYYTPFDTAFFKLPPTIRMRIEAKNRYRLRIGDYRVIYTFDSEKV